jgi:tetratricopeptide (TPR) repeat protein
MYPSVKTVPVLYIRVLLGLVILFGVAGFLASSYREDRNTLASIHFDAARTLAQQGREAEAIAEYRAALSLARGDFEYQLELALALMAEGNLNEAERHLQELLSIDPTRAIPNWALARIADRRDDVSTAETYYHRALYGFWPPEPPPGSRPNSPVNRLEAHFELVEMLARIRATPRLLAELLLLSNELPADAAARKRVARLFLRAESPSNAGAIFADLVAQDEKDWEAFSGLGDAEFAQENYVAARNAFRTANRLNPEDSVTQARLDFSNQILQFDPTLRGLSSAERHRRSVELVRAALAKVDLCRPAGISMIVPDPNQPVMDSAREMLAETRRPRNIADALESNMALALQLWQVRLELCPPVGNLDAADRVLSRLAQQQSS